MSFAFPRARMGAVALAGLFAGSALVLTPATASAAPQTAVMASHSHHHSAHQRKRRIFKKKVHAIMKEAAKQKGKPYSYGAAGPHAFDCSGLVMYVFQHAVGRSLPHNAAAQYGVSHHISRRHLMVGDLIFVDNGGYISHVGIFAGHHHWWVAPHTGERVHKQRIYSAHFKYGRIIRLKHPGK